MSGNSHGRPAASGTPGSGSGEAFDGLGADDARALEAFFGAARAEVAEMPSARFLNAVFADAAEVAAARASRPAPSPVATAPRAGLLERFASLLGGWRGGAALTACALAGFLLGASGSEHYAHRSFDAAANGVSAADAVGDFYDIAALE